jgi:ABC-type glycerol-3-phosphate transport system substrate-binding protein
MYEGHHYVVPIEFNTPLLFYRKDLLAEAGKEPANTIEEYQRQAALFATPSRAGVVMLMRVGDQCATETHWYLSVLGDGWFDDKWQPVFNSERGVNAIEVMKQTSRYAQRGFATAAGDEGTLALQQGFATMGNLWFTRISAMEDPTKSRFVGKFGYTVPAQGRQRMSVTGYAISAFSRQDPDVLFRLMMHPVTKANMRGNAANNVPTRVSLLEDEELITRYPYLTVAKAAGAAGTFFPRLPPFYSVADIVTRRVLQALTGEMGVRAALDSAANETRSYLSANGYYR